VIDTMVMATGAGHIVVATNVTADITGCKQLDPGSSEQSEWGLPMLILFSTEKSGLTERQKLLRVSLFRRTPVGT
jgi:hypothetical protein